MLTIQIKGYSTINNCVYGKNLRYDLNRPMKSIKNFKVYFKGNFFNQAELKYTVT